MDSGDDNQIIRWAGGTPPVHPALLARPEVRAALASHDMGTLFRVLGANGWRQREIGEATGMAQSSVSEIVQGRRVVEYRVLVRIADGLGIARELMNLGPAEGGGAYAGGVTGAESREEVEEVLRRALLATATITFAGQPVAGIRERITLPAPVPVPLPSRILGVHVMKVRDLTRTLRESGRAYGSDPQMSSAAAARASELLEIPGPEPVKQELMAAVAELHIHAGTAAFDAALYDRTLHHYTHGLQLASQAGDTYLQALALRYAGEATVEHGHPNDGLKMLQFGELKADRIPVEDQRERIVFQGSRVAMKACALADSATALAHMGDPDGAATALATARELCQFTAADSSGDLDIVAAQLECERGRLEVAESLAAASVRRWERGSNRARTISGILLATIHVRAGESDGLRLAHGAITGVMRLSSVRARQRLDPLAAALEARPSTDHRELARMTRHTAATQP